MAQEILRQELPGFFRQEKPEVSVEALTGVRSMGDGLHARIHRDDINRFVTAMRLEMQSETRSR